MIKVAIAGKIASGKSQVLEYLKNHGAKTLCLDEVVHFLYENSDDLKNELNLKFKTNKRSEIAKIVFSNMKLLGELEDIINPYVLNELNKFFVENSSFDIVYVAVPMLYKSGFDKHFDKIIIVEAKDEIVIKRLMERNSISREEAVIRLRAQKKDNKPNKKDVFVIENNGALKELYTSIEETTRLLKLHV